MFTVFAQAYENRADCWENSRADQWKPETEGPGWGLHKNQTEKTFFYFVYKITITRKMTNLKQIDVQILFDWLIDLIGLA